MLGGNSKEAKEEATSPRQEASVTDRVVSEGLPEEVTRESGKHHAKSWRRESPGERRSTDD